MKSFKFHSLKDKILKTKAPEYFPTIHSNKTLTTSTLQVPSSAMFNLFFILLWLWDN